MIETISYTINTRLYGVPDHHNKNHAYQTAHRQPFFGVFWRGHMVVIAAFLLVMLSTISNAKARPLKLVMLGDSLVAGYGLPAGVNVPALLQQRLREKGIDVEIINAGVSGDTSAAGLARLDWSVPDDADGVIVELGANDALRGIAPKTAQANLTAILSRLQARGIPAMLAGMRAPPNMGDIYAKSFDAIYPALAVQFDVPLYPFFLDGVAADPSLNLADGIHPNEKGVAEIVSRMMPSIEAFIGMIRS